MNDALMGVFKLISIVAKVRRQLALPKEGRTVRSSHSYLKKLVGDFRIKIALKLSGCPTCCATGDYPPQLARIDHAQSDGVICKEIAF